MNQKSKKLPLNKRFGAPRRHAAPWWRRRRFKIASVAGLTVLLGMVFWWAEKQQWDVRFRESLRAETLAVTARFGLQIRDVQVEGRHQTTKAQLLAALDVNTGQPIFALELAAAKERIEALPWVREATVQRLLPDQIVLRLRERKAMALWQYQRRFALIDEDGRQILEDNLQRFGGLLLVVGKDAPVHTARLLTILRRQPEMMQRVKAAVFVGGRRWNLRLDNGVDIRLPESDTAAAWERLAGYEREHALLARDISVVDLRLPDRLVIQANRPPIPTSPTTGQDT